MIGEEDQRSRDLDLVYEAGVEIDFEKNWQVGQKTEEKATDMET